MDQQIKAIETLDLPDLLVAYEQTMKRYNHFLKLSNHYQDIAGRMFTEIVAKEVQQLRMDLEVIEM